MPATSVEFEQLSPQVCHLSHKRKRGHALGIMGKCHCGERMVFSAIATLGTETTEGRLRILQPGPKHGALFTAGPVLGTDLPLR